MRAAAIAAGGAQVVAAATGRAGLRTLLDPRASFTHVLLNPARDDGLLPAFLSMTCEESASHTELLVMGRAAAAPAHACVIASRSMPGLMRALSLGCAGMNARHRARPTLRELQQALAHRRVETRYQPLVSIMDRTVYGQEVLARLHRGRRGVLGPDHFVPHMEAAGLAGELTELVAGRSFADAAAPHLAPTAPRMALNVPLDVMLLPDTLARLDELRDGVGLDASRVTIELTESRVVGDVPLLRRAVGRMREAGYGVSLDDVSPEMPGHDALLDLPFTSTKIDQAVVRRGASCPDAASFIRRVVDGARARGLLVIAEGVHDAPTWQRVRRAGVDVAQGFVVAPPLPAAALPVWAELWRERTDLN